MQMQRTISSNTLSYRRWRKQNISRQIQIETVSIHKSSSTENTRWKTPTQREYYIQENIGNRQSHTRKNKGSIHTHTNTTNIKVTRSNPWSLISLNIDGLNSSIKRFKLTKCIQKQDLLVWCIQETHLRNKNRHYLRVKGWEKVF